MTEELPEIQIKLNKPQMPEKKALVALVVVMGIAILALVGIVIYYHNDANVAYLMYNNCIRNCQNTVIAW